MGPSSSVGGVCDRCSEALSPIPPHIIAQSLPVNKTMKNPQKYLINIMTMEIIAS